MLNQVLRPIVRNVARNGIRSSSSKVVEVKLPTISDIPAPSGPWKDYYEKRQKIYNTQLIAGVAVLLSTIVFIKATGIIFFNAGPPKEPAPEK